MAVYCAPMITGKVDRTRGYSTNHFKPGYTETQAHDQSEYEASSAAGEQIGQPETPGSPRQVMQKSSQNLLDEELEHQASSKKFQAVQAVLYGKYTVSGSNIETYEIDTGRSATNNVTQSGFDSLVDSGRGKHMTRATILNPYADLASGAVNVIIMDGKAWKQLKRFKKFWTALDTRRGSQTASSRVALKNLGDVVSFKGYYGDTAPFVYKGAIPRPGNRH